MDVDRGPDTTCSGSADTPPGRAESPVADVLFGVPAVAWDVAAELPLAILDGVPGCSRLLVQLLHNRGIMGLAAVERFLRAEWRSSDAQLPDLDQAISRIAAAIRSGERISIFGDFDCDGITSCALLTSALRRLGADAVPFVPSRADDGRGLNLAAVHELAGRGVTLIITTDCGTANVAEVALAATLGIDVIVTDHHPLHGPVAQALALVNPRCAEAGSRHTDLAGAGVAFRVAEALIAAQGQDLASLDESSRDALQESLLDLASIGTLADIVALSPENWALARAGLARLNTSPRPGLRALISRSQLAPGRIVARDVSFALAPRLNAGGRLDDPMLALRLLLVEDDAQADRLAEELDALNLRRQQLTEELAAEAREQALAELAAERGSRADRRLASPVLIARGRDWPLGILGLVASRLSEEFRRPVCVLSIGDDECRGSVRAPQGYDVGAVLAARADLFRRFGGHPQAAGFAFVPADMDALVAYLRQSVVPLREERLSGDGALLSHEERVRIDCRLPLRRLAADIYADLERLQPTGPGFADPVFLSPRVRLVRCWRSGRDGRNLRLALRDGTIERTVVWPRRGELCERVREAIPSLPPLDIAYTVAPFHRVDTPTPDWTIRIEAVRPAQ